MELKKQYLVGLMATGMLALLSACGAGASYQTAGSGWDSLRYSNYAAHEPSGFLRMGK